MRVWTFFVFVFFVVVLTKGVQTKGRGKGMNLEHRQYEDLSPDEKLKLDAFTDCTLNWGALIGQPCTPMTIEEIEQEVKKILQTPNQTPAQKLATMKEFHAKECSVPNPAECTLNGTCECPPNNFCPPQDEQLLNRDCEKEFKSAFPILKKMFNISEESEKEFITEITTFVEIETLGPIKNLGCQIDPQSVIFVTPFVLIQLY